MNKSYKARYLPVHRGVSGWDSILGNRAKFPQLEENIAADFVIIGAGFAGLSAARRLKLSEPKAKIVILEASDVAEGASGRNSGFMIDLPHDLTSDDYSGAGNERALIDLNREAHRFAEDAVIDYKIDPNYFDKAGKVNGAVSDTADAHNKSYAKHLASLGETSEVLDAKQMAELTGSTHYVSGLYTPGTIMLQPAGYIRGLATGLMRDGIEIYTHSPVIGFEKSGAKWRLRTQKALIEASKIILTVNGHLASFGFYSNALMQIFLFATMTSELDNDALKKLGGAPRWGITPSDPMGTSMRRIDSGQGGNRILARTCSVLRSKMSTSKGDLARATRVMRTKFDRRYPQLSGLPMEYAWAGHLCLALNGVSVAKELENGVFSACVQNGLGTTRGTMTGMAAADAALGNSSAMRDYFDEQDNPKTLPPEPFRGWGANIYMRWKELKAAEE